MLGIFNRKGRGSNERGSRAVGKAVGKAGGKTGKKVGERGRVVGKAGEKGRLANKKKESPIMDLSKTRKKSKSLVDRSKKVGKFRDKLMMYDMIIANLIAGIAIIEPSKQLNNSEIALGFSNISSEETITKYYIIRALPDFVENQLMSNIRRYCIRDDVRINFYTYGAPHKIDWNSPEMRSKLNIFKRYNEAHSGDINVFEYRAKRQESLNSRRIYLSTKYLNESELDNKRTLARISIVVSISAVRTDKGILNMTESIEMFKQYCNLHEIKIKEIRVNMADWLRQISVFSLLKIKDIDGRISRRVVTDDILANFSSYKQGMIGTTGICLGVDVISGLPVLRKLRDDPDKAENWLIGGETGSGKSFYVKSLIPDLLGENFVVTAIDIEGDEYNSFADFIKAANPEDVAEIVLGRGSSMYHDPMPIPDLTGDLDLDKDFKVEAINFTLAYFNVIIKGDKGVLDKIEEKIVSTAIRRVYESVMVTDDMSTWYRSKGLKIRMVYEEMKLMKERKEFIDFESDNEIHTKLCKIVEYSSIYFEKGEAKYGTFLEPIPTDKIYQAKFIWFSFGMKGMVNSVSDKTILALKQLSVACLATQISNHCKYVRKCYNVKIWEEFQRWGEVEGSADIIINSITGGRKRGDINFIVSNDLAKMFDSDNRVCHTIIQNIQNIVVGKVDDSRVQKLICSTRGIEECLPALETIAKASSSGRGKNRSTNKYNKAFLAVLDDGKKAIISAKLPKAMRESRLYRTGIEKERKEIT